MTVGVGKNCQRHDRMDLPHSDMLRGVPPVGPASLVLGIVRRHAYDPDNGAPDEMKPVAGAGIERSDDAATRPDLARSATALILQANANGSVHILVASRDGKVFWKSREVYQPWWKKWLAWLRGLVG